MKRKTLTLVFTGLITLILTTLTMNAFLRKDKSQATDEQGHVLTGLWADWNKAVQQDRPKLQEEILAQIRDRAMDQRLAWDFYDASTRYVGRQLPIGTGNLQTLWLLNLPTMSGNSMNR